MNAESDKPSTRWPQQALLLKQRRVDGKSRTKHHNRAHTACEDERLRDKSIFLISNCAFCIESECNSRSGLAEELKITTRANEESVMLKPAVILQPLFQDFQIAESAGASL